MSESSKSGLGDRRIRGLDYSMFKGQVAGLQEDNEVLFIDVDKCLNLDRFGNDGVHFNRSGNTILGKFIVEVMVNQPFEEGTEVTI